MRLVRHNRSIGIYKRIHLDNHINTKPINMKTDNQIQRDVMDELGWEPILESSRIGVAVHHGVVTLSGSLNNYLKKVTAEKAARRVKDVKGVAMDIEVRLGNEDQRTDTEIAEAAVNALRWNNAVPDDKIQVKVDNGWVTLTGDVKWQYQRRAAEDVVHSLTGIRGITNLIRMVPPVNTVLVRDSIRRALERNADVEASRIDIETNGNQVILKGKVHSWNERTIVENAAWSSPGVTAVQDDLLIVS
jgi:osmotically-inducible protein OsmY